MEKLQNKEIYENIIDSLQTLINRKIIQKQAMKLEGRNRGIEYGAVINEISTLENAKMNLLIFM